jgi:hypothetical protein
VFANRAPEINHSKYIETNISGLLNKVSNRAVPYSRTRVLIEVN